MRRNLFALPILALVLAGCGTVAEVSKDIDESFEEHKTVTQRPVVIAPRSRVQEVRGAFLPVTQVKADTQGAWLRRRSVALDIKHPTPLSSVIAKFSEQGINIVTDLPLSTYTYFGKVNKTSAEAALRLVLGSVGLDYRVDDERQIVFIRPTAAKTWYVSIGNRRSIFSSDNNENGSGSSGSSGSSGFAASGFGGDSTSGGFGGDQSGVIGGFGDSGSRSSSGGGSGSDETTTAIYASDDFWASLARELDARLSVLVPNGPVMSQAHSAGLPPIPPLPQDMMPSVLPESSRSAIQDYRGADQELYTDRKIGTYSLNPETGSITVQAPHWILADLDTYIKGVQAMYNTDISFSGEVVLITTNRSDSEGFDITAFAQWAGGKYGAVFANNALGGVTMSLPTDGSTGSIIAGTQGVGGPLAGFRYHGSNALDLFNNYLSEIGKVSVIERPMLTTTSGVPGIFEKKKIEYYNTVSQQAASGGTGSAAVATQNQIIPVELGTELRINPRIDVATGLIRAQLKFDQVIQSGLKNIQQTVSAGNGVQSITTQIPLLTRQNISGEILLRDGDLIIVGGQTEDSLLVDESGLPNPSGKGPMGGAFGIKGASRGAQTYYFALSVRVNKRK